MSASAELVAPEDRQLEPNFAEQLQRDSVCVSVTFVWMSMSRAFNDEQRRQTADTFGADEQIVRARRDIIDTTTPTLRALSNVRNNIRRTWKNMTIPYPEKAKRLLPVARTEEFETVMRDYDRQFRAAHAAFSNQWDTLTAAGLELQGQLGDATDYVDSVADRYSFAWDFVSVDPPEYLRQVSPASYERQQQAIRARMEEALVLGETMLMTELEKLSKHLLDRLTPGKDGEKKVLRGSALEKMRDFFDRCNTFNVRSNDDLNQLIETARGALKGIDIGDARTDETVREALREQMTGITQTLDGLLTDQRRRRMRVAEDE